MVPRLGWVEILVLFLSAAVIAGVVKLFQKAASERTIATLVEENRRLREEIAALKGEKPHVETEV
jgi:cell division protein FtsB